MEQRIVLIFPAGQLTQEGGKHFSTSFVILSVPADLPHFSSEIALLISGRDISESTSLFTNIWFVLELSSWGMVLVHFKLLVGL